MNLQYLPKKQATTFLWEIKHNYITEKYSPVRAALIVCLWCSLDTKYQIIYYKS